MEPKREILKKYSIKENLTRLEKLKNKVKVIYTDIDGTLLGPGGSLFLDASKRFTLTPAKAIIKSLKRGIDIVPVSGRGRHQLHADARILGFKNYLAELGCILVYNLGEKVVLNAGKLRTEKKLPLEVMEEMGVARLLFKKFKGYLEHHTPWSEHRECTYVFRGHVNVEEVNKFLKEKGFKDLIFLDNGVINTVSPTLMPGLPRLHAYHLLPKGAGKASGVRKDRKIRGLKKEECVAIGDALTDLELADEVGIFFLVRNAVEEQPEILEAVKKRNNVFITQKKMGLGFAEVVDILT